MCVYKTSIMCLLIFCTVVCAQNSMSGQNDFLDDVVYDCGQNSDGLEIGDIDDDGKNELVVGNRGTEDFSIFKLKEGTWNEMELYYTHQVKYAMGVIHIADINGDGLNDVILAHYTDYTDGTPVDDKFGVCYQNPTTHRLDPEVEYDFPNGTSSRSLGVGDVTGDDKPEIILVNERDGSNLFVWSWNEDQEDLELIGTYGGITGWTISISVGDVNDDGRNDVITHGDRVRVYAQNANGGLNSAVSYSGGGESADLGDINNDGLPDVVGSNAFGNGIDIWEQTTSGTLRNIGSTYCGGYTEDCEVTDLNDDGLADACVASRDRSELYVFLQESGGLSETPIQYVGVQGKWLNELAVGDLNGNGMTDVAGSNWGNPGVGGIYDASVSVWFYDQPTGRFMHQSIPLPHRRPFTLIVTENRIRYTLFENRKINLSISDAQGRIQRVITNEFKSAGDYFLPWARYQKSSGAYYIHLKTEDASATETFISVK